MSSSYLNNIDIIIKINDNFQNEYILKQIYISYVTNRKTIAKSR